MSGSGDPPHHWLDVSRPGFYEWRDRAESATAVGRAELTVLITSIFDWSDETYGYRRVHAEVVRRGETAGAELVRSIMRAEGLVACQPVLASPLMRATPLGPQPAAAGSR